MSTIFLADNIMVADSRGTSDYVQDNIVKIHETDLGVYGFFGALINMEVMLHAFEVMMTPFETEDGDISFHNTVELQGDFEGSGLIYFMKNTGETGEVAVDSKGFMRKSQLEQPISGGSGGTFALMAYKCGKNPVEAVEMVCNFDPYTGGEVVAIQCDDPQVNPEPIH